VIEWRCSLTSRTRVAPGVDFYERPSVSDPRNRPGPVRPHAPSRGLYGWRNRRPFPLGVLLSLPTPDRYPLTLPPVRQREETFRLMLEWLGGAPRGPILLVVEDLQWVDASTLESWDKSSPNSCTTNDDPLTSARVQTAVAARSVRPLWP